MDDLGSSLLALMKLVLVMDSDLLYDSSLWMTLDVSTEVTCGCNSGFVCVSAVMVVLEDVFVATGSWISFQQLSSSVQSEDVPRP